tara:strand:- start:1104 stop:2201 length:1098 start_codon:yes stop_codon:yes gene_type:complete
MGRPTKVIVNRQAIKNNLALANSLAPTSKFVSVIKANAYGHGLIEIAETLADSTDAFGVACIEEAISIRKAGVKNPILLMEGLFTEDELQIASEKNFWLMIENKFHFDALLSAKLSNPIKIWFGIDTGMHRLGFQQNSIYEDIKILESSSNVKKPIVIASHFASADNLRSNFTQIQIDRFDKHMSNIKLNRDAYEESLSNSAGLIGWVDSHRDWERPGYLLFGNSPFMHSHEVENLLEPAMEFKSKIISVRSVSAGESVGYGQNWTAKRHTKIATVTVGYGDGYPRNAKNGTPTLVNNKICPLVGKVSMDMITIDVTDVREVNIGDDVVLWGHDLPVNKVAKYCDSIGWELLSRITSRVPRFYIN